MMMVALLCGADLALEAEDLGAIFAHLAVHGRVADENLAHSVFEGFNHQRVIVEIGGLEKFDRRMA